MKILLITLLAFPSITFAKEVSKIQETELQVGDTELIAPDSPYCHARIAIETKSYQDQKKAKEKIADQMARDMKSYLKTISSSDRKDLAKGLEGIEKLKGLNSGADKFKAQYNKKKTQKFEFETDWESSDQHDPLGVPPYKATITHYLDKIPMKIKVILSTPEKENEEIKIQIEELKKMPPLEEHLAQQVTNKCFNRLKEAAVNSDERNSGKDLPVKVSKEKIKSSAGAVKN